MKSVLQICSKCTGEHTYRSVISIKMHYNFIEITFLHGHPLVNLLHICRKSFFEEHLWGTASELFT